MFSEEFSKEFLEGFSEEFPEGFEGFSIFFSRESQKSRLNTPRVVGRYRWIHSKRGDLSNTLTAAARRQHYGEECIIDFQQVIQTPCSSSHAESA